jgi:ABC-type branched-subunit amino acid transport system substrate-binding protein
VAGAQGYDSVYLLAAAIKQAGSTDGAKVRAVLRLMALWSLAVNGLS